MSRLAYFPCPYPGELLYSVLARYHRHMGAPSSIQTMEALYGRRTVTACLDLPGHLPALAARMPDGSGWTVDRMIDELTLFPYYTVFQPATVRAQARAAMGKGGTGGLLMRLGLAAFKMGHATRLRFCTSCLEEMQIWHGECYWKRDHQLPGVLVCPEHGCPLRDSSVSLTAYGRHVYVPANQRTCPPDAPALAIDPGEKARADLQRLARLSRDLLEQSGPSRSMRGWTEHYRTEAQRIGCVYSARRIDQRKLRARFFSHHRDVLALVPGVANDRISCGWLDAMFRKHRKAFHPLEHVLVQDFLEQQENHPGPFGHGPWPCLNPLVSHRGRMRIPTVSMHRNHGHGVGTFTCDCGYVYTRSFREGDEHISPPRFQAYGPLLAPVMRCMVLHGRSLRAIASRLELDPKTVVGLATGLGLSVVWKGRAEVKKVASHLTSRIAGKGPFIDKGQAWSKPRVDWKVLDRQVSKKIRQAVKEIVRKSPPIRVSASQIERMYWGRGWLSKRVAKLPTATQCVRDVVESIESFRIRRIRWAIKEICRSGVPLKGWRILRMAGLHGDQAGLVERLLAEPTTPRRRTLA